MLAAEKHIIPIRKWSDSQVLHPSVITPSEGVIAKMGENWGIQTYDFSNKTKKQKLLIIKDLNNNE